MSHVPNLTEEIVRDYLASRSMVSTSKSFDQECSLAKDANYQVSCFLSLLKEVWMTVRFRLTDASTKWRKQLTSTTWKPFAQCGIPGILACSTALMRWVSTSLNHRIQPTFSRKESNKLSVTKPVRTVYSLSNVSRRRTLQNATSSFRECRPWLSITHNGLIGSVSGSNPIIFIYLIFLAFPYNPHAKDTEPFRKYFDRTWIEIYYVSLHNFLSTSIATVSPSVIGTIVEGIARDPLAV